MFIELLRRVPGFVDRMGMLTVGMSQPAGLSHSLQEARRGVELRQIDAARQLQRQAQQPAAEQQQPQQEPAQQEAAQEAQQQEQPLQQSLEAALAQAKHLAALLGQAC